MDKTQKICLFFTNILVLKYFGFSKISEKQWLKHNHCKSDWFSSESINRVLFPAVILLYICLILLPVWNIFPVEMHQIIPDSAKWQKQSSARLLRPVAYYISFIFGIAPIYLTCWRNFPSLTFTFSHWASQRLWWKKLKQERSG